MENKINPLTDFQVEKRRMHTFEMLLNKHTRFQIETSFDNGNYRTYRIKHDGQIERDMIRVVINAAQS